jgi:diguanylate cyclase (GGDEF)-like protein/PAS domain S-box-containing protein
MRRLTSLKAQISREVFKLFGAYITGFTLLSILLAVYGINFYHQEEFNHCKALIATRLSSELSASFKLADDLAHATEVWTGLTDSDGRGSYLLPVLAKANQSKYYKFDLLDYRGRYFIHSQNTISLLLDAVAGIQKSIETRTTQLELLKLEEADYLAVSLPITADFTDIAIGIVLLHLDLGQVMSNLTLPADLKVKFKLSPFVARQADPTQHTEQFQLAWRDAGKDYALYVQLQQSYLSAFLFFMTGLFISLTCGGLLFLGLKRWTQHFSERTTQRLEKLVHLVTDTVQGRSGKSFVDTTGDEISKVSSALHSLLQQQLVSTQKLAVFSRVFETAAEAILITNQQGLVVDVNNALTNMTGFKKEALVNRPAGRLYIKDGAEVDFSNIVEYVQRHGFWRGNSYVSTQQNTRLPVQLAVSALLDAEGNFQGHVWVFSDTRAIREAEKKLKALLSEDALTQLPNYRAFLEYIQKKSDNCSYAVIFIDLDNFKTINDTFGHEQGDEVIRKIAQHLQSILPTGHFLCRRSGDEFIVVMDVNKPLPEFKRKLNRIFEPATISLHQMGTVHVSISFSVGAALYPEHSKTTNELLVFADTALLVAKESGRNQIKWLNAQMMTATLRKTKVNSKLPAAIREGKIQPYYQPEVDLLTGKIIGFEALARWRDDELGVINPAEFIPLAEQSGAIEPLTCRMLTQVVKDSRSIRTHFPNAMIAFNASPQLLSEMRLFSILSNLASESENALDGFVLEITETDFAMNPQEMATQLQAIMGLGVRIAIDDFGKSYSSLSRLASMPIQKLKIDMSFTAGLAQRENEKIISGILALAKSMDLEVTAEGIETRFQRDTLLALGCQQAQGYFYSKPLKLKDVLALPKNFGPSETDEIRVLKSLKMPV